MMAKTCLEAELSRRLEILDLGSIIIIPADAQLVGYSKTECSFVSLEFLLPQEGGVNDGGRERPH